MSSSPWGIIDFVDPTAVKGITFVTTPSHGGFRLTPSLFQTMHPALQSLAIRQGASYFFEEDCAAAAVVYAWPEIDPREGQREETARSLKYWYPEVWAQVAK